MTELLRRAIAEIEKLPDEQQNAIATQLLTELEDEQAWQTRFAATTNQQWEQLAAKIRQEIANGEIPLDDVFPT